ncbi:hypothetical protein [Lysobacter sp. P5_B9]
MAVDQGQFDATEYFALNDIALWTTSLRRDVEYQSGIHDGKTVVQTMRSTTAETITAVFEGAEEPMDMLRTYVNFGVRSVFRGDDDQQEVALYTLEATFAVEYAILKMPSEDKLQSFVEFNCTHNAWPFWRQHVYDTLKRASLPVPVIPFFSGKPGGRPGKIKLKRASVQGKKAP